MIRAVEEVVGDHIVRGVASVPYGIRETFAKNNLEQFLPNQDSKVEVFEGAKYNLPDQECVDATRKICELAERGGGLYFVNSGPALKFGLLV